MCGIAGYVAKQGRAVDPAIIEAMLQKIIHRGPDGGGVFTERNLGLGHRRLAILDLSPDGAQPMHSADGRFVLTFNGEIYNYIEIREELKQFGWTFRSHTDSEVILAAYAQWGAACVNKFNGMWAFVIYDRQNNRLFGSRDRFGVKPFYYLNQADSFAFASELRQLLPLLPQVRPNISKVSNFLLTSFSDYDDETYFQDVIKLPASHNFSYDLTTGQFEISRYYTISLRDEFQHATAQESVQAYGDIFRDAVKLRLRSDVQVGTCLSGGLDSSSVAAIAASLYARDTTTPFSAITAVSEQASNDESMFAKQVVEHCGLNWLTVKPTYQDFVHSLPAVVLAQEEPYGSPSWDIFMRIVNHSSALQP